MRTKKKKRKPAKYKVGDDVIIRENIHLNISEKNIGKVVKVLDQVAYGNVGMYAVAYSYQGKNYEHPFSEYSLEIADKINLKKYISIYGEILDKFTAELEVQNEEK